MNEKETRQILEATVAGTEHTRRMESEDSAMLSEEIIWVGGYWTSGKHLKHYDSFRINGVTIPVRSFCYIMIEKRGRLERLVAYILDLYEDKKSQKKMKVKWLHKSKEIESQIPPPEPLENELFMTRYTQVLRLECCDGVVYVLTPNHYEASKPTLSSSGEHVYVCGRHFGSSEGVKLYDVSAVKGYWSQKIFSSGYIPQYLFDTARANTNFHEDEQAGSADAHEDELAGALHVIRSGVKAPRSSRRRAMGRCDLLNDEGDWTPQQESCQLSYDAVNAVSSNAVNLLKVFHNTDSGGASMAFGQDEVGSVGDKVEILSQDSGLRGCWFRCTVLETSTSLKVRYDDILEVDTEKPLEEWVSASKLAFADKLGFRIPGRRMMRPFPPEVEKFSAYEQGSAVDAWGGEGWWEGIFMGREASGLVKVAFPAENCASLFDESKVRISREWVDGQWLAVRADANISDKISGLHTERLISCPANDRISCPDFLLGREAASESPNQGPEARDSMLPDRAIYEPIGECKESVKLSNHYNRKWSAKVSESSSVGHREDLISECVRANSSRSISEDNGTSQLAELQQLDVVRDREYNTDVVRPFLKMSRKRNRNVDSSFFARSTTLGVCGSRDPSADVLLNQLQEQEDLNVGVFRLNKLTEIGDVEAKRPQYGFEQVNSASGASVGGPLFNSVSVQNLVLSR